MTTEGPSDYVALMLASVVQAQDYVKGMAKEDFLSDPKTQDAVILKLLIIG